MLSRRRLWMSIDDVVRWMAPEYIPTCNAIYLFSSPLLQWRQFIGWVRKTDNGARAARNKKKKKFDSDVFTNHSFAQLPEPLVR